MTDAPASSSDADTPAPAYLFGEVACQMGLLHAEQVQNALKIQAEQKASGSAKKIGEILHDRHELELRAIQKVLLEQSRRREKTQGGSAPASQSIGWFQILSTLGSGGMGHVYKAHDPKIGKVVALKVLSLRLTDDAEFIARFKREVETTAALSHPNIVAGFGSGSIDGRPYLTMEFVEGLSLGKLLETQRRLPEKRALEIAREVARALDYAHAHGVVHRDVKPDNVLIGESCVKLTDFGLAKLLQNDQRLTQSGIALGTPHYISPEQVSASRYIDHRADIYGLGAMLYHMLTGRVPFEGATNNEIMLKHLNQQPQDPRELAPGISPHAVMIVHKALAKKAAERYDSAGAIIEDLSRAIAGKAPIYATKLPAGSAAAERGGCAGILVAMLVLTVAMWALMLYAVTPA
ncbi:MAG TPA: serine/threonine-protein kinase [Planctomycetota bacterium]|nr:serine/threonine-protein kinase [Planctomycetota bacterium]